MNINEKEKQLINIDFITSIFLVLSATISLITTYNARNNLLNKKTIFSKEEQYKINVVNKTIFVFIVLVFLYVNYENYKIAKIKKKYLTPFQIQLLSSILTVIVSLLILYSILISNAGSISNIENPEL